MKEGNENLLLTAGPAPVSPVVRQVLSQSMLYHRSVEFVEIFKRVTSGLKYLFQTEYDVIILTSSGTGGMEAVITNLFSPGETVLVVENGKFSERWSDIAERFGLDIKRLQLPWGKSVTRSVISEVIKVTPELKAIFLTHCETSTGALTDLETIVGEIRSLTSALIIVDAISSAGVLPLKMDQWQIDVVVAASQKGLGLPPGLALVAINKRVWQFVEQAELPRYYFDFIRARQALRLDKGSAFTPAIPLVLALDVVLNNYQEQGLEKIWQKRKNVAENFRAKISQSGFSLFPELPADALTVIALNDPVQTEKIVSLLREKYRVTVSKGQGQLLNKVIRIGHFVNMETEQLDHFLEVFQSAIKQTQ